MIYVFRYLVIAVQTVIITTPMFFWSLVDRSGEPTVRLARIWVRWMLGAIGIEVRTVGAENLDRENPGVLMSNHRSVFDIPALIHTVPTSFRFVAKKELTRIPFFGWALAVSGQILVDRSRRSKAIGALKEAARHIVGGTKVLVFPEGTRSDTAEMLPFKSGGFHLAIANGWPIFPVGIAGSDAITPKGSLRVEPGRICIVFGEPIETAGITETERSALKEQVRQRVSELIREGEDLLRDDAAGESASTIDP